MKSILFVCLGNICRSPLAEAIAKNISNKYNLDINIDSAGTSGWHIGESPCENSIKIAKLNNLDISDYKARKIEKQDKTKYKYIVVMDRSNYDDLKRLNFENIHLIGDYGGYEGKDVPDPYYYKGFKGFEKVFDMLNVCINDFFDKKGLLN